MKKDLLSTVGFLIYIILSCFDRFILPIPDVIYIPVMVADIIMIFVGIILMKKNR